MARLFMLVRLVNAPGLVFVVPLSVASLVSLCALTTVVAPLLHLVLWVTLIVSVMMPPNDLYTLSLTMLEATNVPKQSAA